MVYFIQKGNNGPIKIGSSRNPEIRLKALQCGIKENLDLIGIMDGSFEQEKETHTMFRDDAIGNEWFRPSKDLLSYISKINNKDITTCHILNEKYNESDISDYIRSGMCIDDILENIERMVIENALGECDGYVKQAAKMLKINYRSMRYRLSKYNIIHDEFRI